MEGETRAPEERIAAGSEARGRPRAIETAVLDALTKRAGMPLWAFFGGVERALVTDVTLPIASVEEAGQAAAERAAGFGRRKVKVGGPSAGNDLARLLAIREARRGRR